MKPTYSRNVCHLSVSASQSDGGGAPLDNYIQLNDTLNLYGGIARGYKGGGFNTATDGVEPIGYDPETAMSYEVGLRNESSNLRYSVALFYAEFSDLQVQAIVNSVAFTSNAAKARSQGLEAEMQWHATDNLSMFANYAYVDAKYTEGVIYAGGETYDADGLKLVRSPENMANLGATFTGDLGEWGDWSLFRACTTRARRS